MRQEGGVQQNSDLVKDETEIYNIRALNLSNL